MKKHTTLLVTLLVTTISTAYEPTWVLSQDFMEKISTRPDIEKLVLEVLGNAIQWAPCCAQMVNHAQPQKRATGYLHPLAGLSQAKLYDIRVLQEKIDKTAESLRSCLAAKGTNCEKEFFNTITQACTTYKKNAEKRLEHKQSCSWDTSDLRKILIAIRQYQEEKFEEKKDSQ